MVSVKSMFGKDKLCYVVVITKMIDGLIKNKTNWKTVFVTFPCTVLVGTQRSDVIRALQI